MQAWQFLLRSCGHPINSSSSPLSSTLSEQASKLLFEGMQAWQFLLRSCGHRSSSSALFARALSEQASKLLFLRGCRPCSSSCGAVGTAAAPSVPEPCQKSFQAQLTLLRGCRPGSSCSGAVGTSVAAALLSPSPCQNKLASTTFALKGMQA